MPPGRKWGGSSARPNGTVPRWWRCFAITSASSHPRARREQRHEQRLLMTRSIRFFLILGIGLLAIDGAIFLFWWGQDRAHIAPTVASSGAAAIGGPFRLSATDGKTVTDASFRG